MIAYKKNLVYAIAEESTLYLPSKLLKLNLVIKNRKDYVFFLSNWMKGEIGLRYFQRRHLFKKKKIFFQRRQESSIPLNYYGKVVV